MFYTDKNLINNSSLSCFLFVLFVEEYETISVDNRHPDLIQLLIILPFVWHKLSRDAIKTKKIIYSIRCCNIRESINQVEF